MSAVENHIEKHDLHIYERSVSNIEIYRCTHPDCSHYIKREFLIGKRAECCKCHQSFIIPKSQLKAGQKKPGRKNLVCFTCTKSPKAIVQQQVVETLTGIFDKQEDEEIKQVFQPMN